ncbi:MAG TPA: NAD-dependent epimerase/dehydratase family protein [Stellaceae bacterium]|nr:NAD-dependent epimerase/dehydratase family protein [Stellaceae bacterium]
MAARKILICGATGFIGRNLTQHFAARGDCELHAVRLTRAEYACPGVTWHRVDLRQSEGVENLLKGFDVVIQAAATTSGAKDILTRPYIHTTDNAVMNSLLLRAAYEARVKHFVFFSCSVMYPSSPTPLTEDDWHPGQPMVPQYFASGWTKLYIEQMCDFYARLGATRHTVIRHSNIYGPHDKFDLERSHVFGATVTKVMNARDAIEVWGTGEEARDFLYVDDLVDFVERAVERQTEPFARYNVGSGRAVCVKDIVTKIVAASGKRLAVRHDLSKPTINTSLCLNSAKAARELGWQPRVSLDDGIALTLAWWRRNAAKSAQPEAVQS